jgi:hypothetical protein
LNKLENIVKWAASGFTAASVVLTAFNIYPANVFVGLAGSVGWAWVGYRWQQSSLVLLNVFFCMVYLIGLLFMIVR